MKKEQFAISPIGYVSVDNKGGFFLKLEKPFIPALKAVDGFSHLNILWWANQVDSDEMRQAVDCDQPYKKAPKKVGLFATRSPVRPNPIALTPVPVIEIDHTKGIIHVPFIDAADGTPILDIKPYHPAVDRIKEVGVPKWCAHWPEWYEDSADFDWASEFTFSE